MKIALILFALSAPMVQAAGDPKTCQYWLTYLSEVEFIERALIYDVPKVRERENAYSAIDFELSLKESLYWLRKRVEKENGGKLK